MGAGKLIAAGLFGALDGALCGFAAVGFARLYGIRAGPDATARLALYGAAAGVVWHVGAAVLAERQRERTEAKVRVMACERRLDQLVRDVNDLLVWRELERPPSQLEAAVREAVEGVEKLPGSNEVPKGTFEKAG